MKNKVVWITGASSGIGESLAYELSSQGAKLILSARNKKNLTEVAKRCSQAVVLPIDLSDSSSFDRVVEEAISLFGHIDILVNNGGISQRSYARDTSLEVDRKVFEVDFFGTIALTKKLLPHFRERSSGHFVVVSSMVGKFATPLRSTYSAAKHALHGFFDALRAEEFESNIKVTIVCPGYVATNVSLNALTGDGSAQGTMDSATQNGITPENFAKRMIKAIDKEKREVYICGPRERLGLLLSRFFPAALARLVRKMAVT